MVAAATNSLISIIDINLSSYELREFLEEDWGADLLIDAFSKIFSAIFANNFYKCYGCLQEIKVSLNQFIRNTHSNIVNSRFEQLFSDLLRNITKNKQFDSVSSVQLVGFASEEVAEVLPRFPNLEHLALINCQYMIGTSLKDLKLNRGLTKLNLKGSYNIEGKVIQSLISQSEVHLQSLVIDGENISSEDLETIITLLPNRQLNEFRLYYG